MVQRDGATTERMMNLTYTFVPPDLITAAPIDASCAITTPAGTLMPAEASNRLPSHSSIIIFVHPPSGDCTIRSLPYARQQ